ncbi:MAG TPA: helix-turn-helix domain-containing protein, partial [Candidatus Brocadiia bacterium]|nr:helix-turn-helix domain-containing protein [Candidatus Brocadiia bacterium]
MIQVLERAAKVVRVLAEGQGRSFTEVWRASGLNKATASHILATLVSLEWAEKTEDGRYRVGPEAGRLAR